MAAAPTSSKTTTIDYHKRPAPMTVLFPEQEIRRLLETDCFHETFQKTGQQVLLTGLVWWLYAQTEENKKKVVASLVNIAPDSFGRPTLWNVCTSSCCRRQGLAEKLLRSVLVIWRHHPKRRANQPYLYLYVKKDAPYAQRLYEKLGFRVLWSSSMADAWHMVLDVSISI